jgi:hypothetical protein
MREGSVTLHGKLIGLNPKMEGRFLLANHRVIHVTMEMVGEDGPVLGEWGDIVVPKWFAHDRGLG